MLQSLGSPMFLLHSSQCRIQCHSLFHCMSDFKEWLMFARFSWTFHLLLLIRQMLGRVPIQLSCELEKVMEELKISNGSFSRSKEERGTRREDEILRERDWRVSKERNCQWKFEDCWREIHFNSQWSFWCCEWSLVDSNRFISFLIRPRPQLCPPAYLLTTCRLRDETTQLLEDLTFGDWERQIMNNRKFSNELVKLSFRHLRNWFRRSPGSFSFRMIILVK